MKKTSPVLRAAETVMRVLLTACGLAAVGFVIVITGYLVVSGIPAIREVGLIEFLAGTVWKPSTDQFGSLTVILTSGLGAVGEAMAIMMVCGNVANMPSLFSSVRFLTTAIAGEMSYSSGLHRQALFSVALILYCFIMLINMVLNFFLKKKEK